MGGAVVMTLGPPGYGKPSLLSHQEVVEVVKQFGKVAQHMLSSKKWSETSGKNGLEWDCLSVVQDFLVHWLSVPQVLQTFSQHWSTGEQLSMAQVNGLISARNHMAGFDLCNELYKAAFDIAFYTEDYENEQYTDLENTEAVAKVSARFKSTFLTSGSALPSAQLFREFRGRDPTPEALLISLGLKEQIQPKNRGSKS